MRKRQFVGTAQLGLVCVIDQEPAAGPGGVRVVVVKPGPAEDRVARFLAVPLLRVVDRQIAIGADGPVFGAGDAGRHRDGPPGGDHGGGSSGGYSSSSPVSTSIAMTSTDSCSSSGISSSSVGSS